MKIVSYVVVLVLICFFVTSYQTASSSYSSNLTTISGGGTTTTSAGYSMVSAIAQDAVGNVSSSNYAAYLGFFHSAASPRGNALPTISGVGITPASPVTTDDLVCSATPDDAENDTLTVEYMWYKFNAGSYEYQNGGNTSGLSAGVESTINTLDSSNTNKDETWNCSVRTFDGNLYSEWISATKTISNSAPVIQTSNISPTSPTTNDDLLGYCNATDADGDTVTYSWKWYLDGTMDTEGDSEGAYYQQGLKINVANVSSSTTQKNQGWIFSCMANDSILNSSWLNSSEVTIGNALPQINLLKPDDGNTSVRTRRPRFNWSGSDDDGDSLSFNLWVDDNSNFESPVIDFSTQDENYTPTTDLELDTQYYWRVQVYDQTEYVNSSDWTFTTESHIEVKFINASIDFGSMNLSETKNTTSDNPYPFVIENRGNVLVNVTFGVTDTFWQSALAPLDTSYLQYKADDRVEAGSFDFGSSQTSWANVSDENKTLVKEFNYTDSADAAAIDLLVIVPEDEPPGQKSGTFVLEIT